MRHPQVFSNLLSRKGRSRRAVSGSIGNQEGRMGRGQKGPHCGLCTELRWTDLVNKMCQLLSSLETSVILSQLLICCSLLVLLLRKLHCLVVPLCFLLLHPCSSACISLSLSLPESSEGSSSQAFLIQVSSAKAVLVDGHVCPSQAIIHIKVSLASNYSPFHF